MQEIAERIGRRLQGVPFQGTLKFDCGTAGVIVLADGTASTQDRETDCTLRIKREDLVKLLTGKLNPMLAMATGRLKLSGDPSVALRFSKLISGG